jgi:hypothetical protein
MLDLPKKKQEIPVLCEGLRFTRGIYVAYMGVSCLYLNGKAGPQKAAFQG